MSKVQVTFKSIDADYITKGDAIALTGWWMAAEESLALKLSASAYADLAGVQVRSANTDTIRQYVGAIRSILQGKVLKVSGAAFKMSDFGCIADVRLAVRTANGSARKAGAKIRGGNQKVTVSPVEKLVHDAEGMSKADIRKAIKALQALV